MNLVQTVSTILKKQVTLEEAKDFAANQYGVLTAFNKDLEAKLNPDIETRVYILAHEQALGYNKDDICNWLHYLDHHGSLTDEALHFISACEEEGEVYTLHGFVNACNTQQIYFDNKYIFITNKY